MLQLRERHRFQQVVCRRNTWLLWPPLYWMILNEIWCVWTHLVCHRSLLLSQMFAFLLFAILYCYIWVCIPDGTKHCLQPWPFQCHTLHWVFPVEVFLEVVQAHWICSNWLRMNFIHSQSLFAWTLKEMSETLICPLGNLYTVSSWSELCASTLMGQDAQVQPVWSSWTWSSCSMFTSNHHQDQQWQHVIVNTHIPQIHSNNQGSMFSWYSCRIHAPRQRLEI